MVNEYSFDAVCQLGTVNSTVTALGDANDRPEFGDDVFCSEKSVGYKEIKNPFGYEPEGFFSINQNICSIINVLKNPQRTHYATKTPV